MLTGDITKAALSLLDHMSFECWKVENRVTVRGRTFKGKKGIPDIGGYKRVTGVALYAEVKNENDTLRPEQKELMDKAKMSGCHCFIATVDKNKKFTLKEY